MMKKKENYFKFNKRIFIDSFKEIDIRFIFMFLYDLAIVSIIAVSFIAFSYLVRIKSAGINLLSMNELQKLPTSELANITVNLQEFLIILLIGFLLFAVILFIAMSYFKGRIWFLIADKKYTNKIAVKFFILNGIWIFLWILPITGLILIMQKDFVAPFVVIVFPIMLHFTIVLHILFTKIKDDKKITTIFKTYLDIFKKTFYIGVTKSYMLFLPYLIMFIMFFVVMQLYWFYMYVPDNITFVISIGMFLIFIGWQRIYLHLVLKDYIR